MTARTVPPSGPHLFPLRDLTLATRRNLTRGLALSAMAHLALLAAFLTARQAEPPLRFHAATVELVPSPPVYVPPAPPTVQPWTDPLVAHDGIWDPVERLVFDTLDPVVNGVAPDGVGDEGVRQAPPGDSRPGAGDISQIADPAEGTFVHFDEGPVPIHRPAPDYPGWAKENGISGTVVLRVLVDARGRVKRVSVVRGIKGLTEAAQEALRLWTFRPASTNGRPLAVWVEVPVEFRLGG
jgi:periplasmic protein TonB